MNDISTEQVYRFTTDGPLHLDVDLRAGDLLVTAVEADDHAQVEVEVHPMDPHHATDVEAAAQTRVEFIDGKLSVVAPRDRLRALSSRPRAVRVLARVPSGSSLHSKTGLGDIATDGTLGDCRVATGAGRLRVASGTEVSATTGAGDVTVEQATGSLHIRTGSGSVVVGEAAGPVTIGNGNGDTTVETVAGVLRVRAGNGRVNVGRAARDLDVRSSNGPLAVGEVVQGDVALATAMGDVEVGIAEGTAALLKVRTQFGRVDNQLTSVDGPAREDRRVVVDAHTSFGDIRIVRAAPGSTR
jgi:hypothetical protein